MPNADRLKKTVEEIETDKFKWEQENWTKSDSVFPEDKIAFEDLPRECGTSYCFAGRVTSLRREMLFESFGDSSGFSASAYFLPLEDEVGDSETGTILDFLYRAVKDEDGNVSFEHYTGPMMSARGGAIRDLDITHGQAEALFSVFNDIHDVKDIVTRIIEGRDLVDDDDEGWDD